MLFFHADLFLQYCSSDEFRLMSGKSLQFQRQRICVIANCKSVNWSYILTDKQNKPKKIRFDNSEIFGCMFRRKAKNETQRTF